MILEVLEKNTVNIKDLVLPQHEQSRGMVFDPLKEVTEDDLREIKAWLNLTKNDVSLDHRIYIAEVVSSLKRIFPQRCDELGVDKNLLEILRGPLKFASTSIDRALEHLTAIREISPQDFPHFTSDSYWLRALGEIEHLKDDPANLVLLRVMTDTQLAFPSKDPIDTSFIELPDINRYLNFWRQSEDWSGFAEVGMRYRLISPDGFPQLDIKQDDWLGMRKSLKKYRTNKLWDVFAIHMMYMSVMTAEEIQITDKGLEVIMPPTRSLSGPIPKLPLERRF